MKINDFEKHKALVEEIDSLTKSRDKLNNAIKVLGRSSHPKFTILLDGSYYHDIVSKTGLMVLFKQELGNLDKSLEIKLSLI